jgi:cobalt-precorrin 5A hydrolase/precorrin-3B C17-methyltransferase
MPGVAQTGWENVAIVAVTRGGTDQGRHLLALASGATLYVPARFASENEPQAIRVYRTGVGPVLMRLFQEGQTLVVFAALGLVIRALAPVMRDKRDDPGVVVVDEQARHVISVLSGHRGGANAVAQAVAKTLGATPVITTASELQHLPALDLLGQEFGWRLEDEGGLTVAMAAVVNGDPVLICQEVGEVDWWTGAFPPHVQLTRSLDGVDLSRYAALVLITDRTVGAQIGKPLPLVLYRPRTLAVGIGCERGVSVEEIDKAVQSCLSQHGLAAGSLVALASIDLKRDERGLLALADRYGLQVRWYTAEELRRAGGPSPSPLVLSHVGTPSVAEPAARLCTAHGPLVAQKFKCGRVTVAVSRLIQASRHGRIFLIGLGPGDRKDVTSRALQALAECQAVIGYRRYLEQIEDLLIDKRVIAGELTQERERAEQTVVLAEQGQTVALVSSGDSGIYGMAGLLFQVLAERGWDPRDGISVEVVPGITALSSCAAMLGAPLMNDFAVVSLSDLLTPWPQIAKRLQAAAEADFVIVLYNPRSARRAREFAQACDILLRYRHGGTPVGLVRRAGRVGTRAAIVTLDQLPHCDVDMETTIFVGNSTTRLCGDRLVTPRGYPGKDTREPSTMPSGATLEAPREAAT